MKQLKRVNHGLRRANRLRKRARQADPILRAELHLIADHHHAVA